MTIHNFRIIQSPVRSTRTGKTPAPRLSYAVLLIHKLTGIRHARCTAIVNEGLQFKCEFRRVVQYSETMLDYGYRIYCLPPGAVDKSNDNNRDVMTSTKFKRL